MANFIRTSVMVIFGFIMVSEIIPWFGTSDQERIDALAQSITTSLEATKQALDADQLPHDQILARYAAEARDMVPQHGDAIIKLAAMGSRTNPKFQEIEQERDLILQQRKENSVDSAMAIERLTLLEAAAKPEVIDEGLIDEINTISALTQGRLAPVGVPAGQNAKPGAALVGNPAYGRWENQGGSQIWTWFGAWALFSALSPGPTYSSWYYDRPWSYDYDRYRSNLGGAGWRQAEMNRMNTSWTNIQKTGQQTGRKPSQYAARNNTTLRRSSAYATADNSVFGNFGKTRGQAAVSGPRNTSIYSRQAKSGGFSSSSRSGSRRSSGGK